MGGVLIPGVVTICIRLALLVVTTDIVNKMRVTHAIACCILADWVISQSYHIYSIYASAYGV